MDARRFPIAATALNKAIKIHKYTKYKESQHDDASTQDTVLHCLGHRLMLLRVWP
jgi:hypothetical protein